MDEKNVLKSLPVGRALFNGRTKFYPTKDGEKVAQKMICDKPIFNPLKFERRESDFRGAYTSARDERSQISDEQSEANFQRAVRRAKSKLYDIVMCNDFKYFVTLTISPESADRTDYTAILEKLSVWLDNRVRKNGLKYALVPEFHADGKSIHFHGFFNDCLRLADSGKKTKDGKPIFNFPQFKLGFTTAIEITGEYVAVCRYILKYVGKSNAKVGKRYYLSGGALVRPRYEYFNGEFDDLKGGYTFAPQGSGRTFCVSRYM